MQHTQATCTHTHTISLSHSLYLSLSLNQHGLWWYLRECLFKGRDDGRWKTVCARSPPSSSTSRPLSCFIVYSFLLAVSRVYIISFPPVSFRAAAVNSRRRGDGPTGCGAAAGRWVAVVAAAVRPQWASRETDKWTRSGCDGWDF